MTSEKQAPSETIKTGDIVKAEELSNDPSNPSQKHKVEERSKTSKKKDRDTEFIPFGDEGKKKRKKVQN